MYCLDGPGGCNKTFIYNYLASAICVQGHKVATTAWTRIAAPLCSDGSTVQSLFKLPVPLLDTSCCNMFPITHRRWDSMVPLHLYYNATDKDVKWNGHYVYVWRCSIPIWFYTIKFFQWCNMNILLPLLRNASRNQAIGHMCISSIWALQSVMK